MLQLAKLFAYIGVFFLIIGGVFFVLYKFGLGKLPGDIFIQRGNFHFYFPITTCILISVILTFMLSLLCRK